MRENSTNPCPSPRIATGTAVFQALMSGTPADCGSIRITWPVLGNKAETLNKCCPTAQDISWSPQLQQWRAANSSSSSCHEVGLYCRSTIGDISARTVFGVLCRFPPVTYGIAVAAGARFPACPVSSWSDVPSSRSCPIRSCCIQVVMAWSGASRKCS